MPTQPAGRDAFAGCFDDDSPPAVLLNHTGSALQHGALGIARSLGRMGVPVYNVGQSPRTAVSASRFVSRTFTLETREAPEDIPVEKVLEIGDRIGRPAILIPTDDVTTVFVNENSDALRGHFIFPDQSPGLARKLSNKKEMHSLCRRFGVPTPHIVAPRSTEDISRLLENPRFPIVFKAIETWAEDSGARHFGLKKVMIAHSVHEVQEILEGLRDADAGNLLLQEYIPGDVQSVWMFNGYFGYDSACWFGITGQKLRQHPPYTGFATLGMCVRNDHVAQTTIDFMKAIGYRGALDIGYRYDARDGCYKLLDVNPRVGGTFRLFLGDNGLDVVRAMYLDLVGQRVPPTSPIEGRKWIVENYDVLSGFRYWRRGALNIAEYVRSLRGIQEAAWFARDDVRPVFEMCFRSAHKLLYPKRGRRRELARRLRKLRRPTKGEKPTQRP
jgi:D-aspartate ligase